MTFAHVLVCMCAHFSRVPVPVLRTSRSDDDVCVYVCACAPPLRCFVRNQVNKEYRNHSSTVLADTMKKAWGANQVQDTTGAPEFCA